MEGHMASVVKMRHKESGLEKKGFYGFSWTTFFFGAFPALFRSDFITFIGAFIVLLALGIFTVGIGAAIVQILFAFFYNKYYTSKLLEGGYEFNDTDEVVAAAKEALGVSKATA
jgi:hypothetical protein